MEETIEPGIYRDPANDELWERTLNGKWRWLNGGRFTFVPDGLTRVGDSFDQLGTN
jgi:hypothetical protein